MAEQLRVDVLLVRLVWIALVFAAGTGVLAYVVMAVIVPERDRYGNVVRSRALTPTVVAVAVGIVVLVTVAGVVGLGAAGGSAGVVAGSQLTATSLAPVTP